MPIYEYQCMACEHQFEALQKMSDARLTECPVCAKPELRKKISATAFHLKGSGWYQTDFKDAGKKKAPETAGKETDGAASAGNEKDVAPAVKADVAGKDNVKETSSEPKATPPAPKPAPPQDAA